MWTGLDSVDVCKHARALEVDISEQNPWSRTSKKHNTRYKIVSRYIRLFGTAYVGPSSIKSI